MKRRSIFLALPVLLAGCGTPPPKPPAVLSLTITGGANQNPDASGTAEPVAVRIYPLVTAGKFNAADPYSLLGKATSLLGSDLAGPSEQTIVAPGATVKLMHKLPDQAQSIGIAVFFRAIDRATWRLVAPVKGHETNALTLRIDGLDAKLVATKPKG